MISILIFAAAALATPAHAPPMTVPAGEWINPAHSVRVRTGSCGNQLCGWVTWANAQATADARDGGSPQLVGLTLLQNYRQTGPTSWQGRVFVPDWNESFYSRIQELGPNQLKISGCIFGGLICKSQIWTRG